MINGQSPPDRWKKNLRISRDLFISVVEELRPFLTPITNSLNHRVLITEKQEPWHSTIWKTRVLWIWRILLWVFVVAAYTVSSVQVSTQFQHIEDQNIYIYPEIKKKLRRLENLRQITDWPSVSDELMEHIQQYLPIQNTLKTTFVINNVIH